MGMSRSHWMLDRSRLYSKYRRAAYWPGACAWETANGLGNGRETGSYLFPEKRTRFPIVRPEEVLSPQWSSRRSYRVS